MSAVSASYAEDGCFEGYEPRVCGEHRTTGDRAWCSADKEWCYPGDPCRGCKLAVLLSIEDVEALMFMPSWHALLSSRTLVLVALWLPCLAYAVMPFPMPDWLAVTFAGLGVLTCVSVIRDAAKDWPRLPGDGQRRPGRRL